MVRIRAEMTDTFGGEPNYSYVRRVEVELPDSASNLAIMRAIKRELGINGERWRFASNSRNEDVWELRPIPASSPWVVFVYFDNQ